MAPWVFYAFDLLHLDGLSLTDAPLHERRAPLPALLDRSGPRLSRELPGTPSAIVAAALRRQGEGRLGG
jgi:ATP-dependent DNA ligase